MNHLLASGRVVAGLATAAALLFSGCARGPETEYGSSRDSSINGTSVFASMVRQRDNELRTAIRLTEELEIWAQGIIRFAPYPGAPAKEEAEWFHAWLNGDPNRWLIYIVRDFDAEAEYWREVRDGLDEQTQPELRAEAEEKHAVAVNWAARLPPKAKKAADPLTWFTVEKGFDPPRVCASLTGPWATDIDAKAAALPLHEPIARDAKEMEMLLQSDDKILAADRGRQLLVIANGSFLLNAALLNVARRPLAERVLDWTGLSGQRVALVEGSFILADRSAAPNIWDLLERLPALRWIAAQVGLAGLLAALARAPRLGRPRPDPVSDTDRPAAHAEALGALLARTGSSREAHELLDRYRQWRHPHHSLSGTR